MKVKSTRKYVKILGIKVVSNSKEGVLREIQSRLKGNKKFYIVTPNPEQILIACEDKQYKEILNSADISIPDGIGLVAAAKFYSLPRPKGLFRRALALFVQGLGVGFSTLFDTNWLETELSLIKGREIFIELIRLANKKGWKVVLLGDSNQSAQKATNKLRQNYISLDIIGLTGPDLETSGKLKSTHSKVVEDRAIAEINKVKPEMLFIGFRSPVQEKWLYRWYNTLNFKCAMVVGGTFDYVSGKKPFPPKWIEDLNLEWFWRLIKGDQKIRRVFRAFPEFVLKVYWEKLIKSSK